MTAPALQFRVVAVPRPQGSKRAFITRPKDPAKKPRAVVVDTDKGPLRDFREAVRSEAVAAAGADWTPLHGALRVVLLFALRRPQKPKFPWPIAKNTGDIEKLCRGVFDAITDAAVWADDGQVVDVRVVKSYPGDVVAQSAPGVIVRIWRVDDTTLPPPSSGQIPLLATAAPGPTPEGDGW